MPGVGIILPLTSPYWPLLGRGVPAKDCRLRNLSAGNEKRRRLLGTRVRAAKAPQIRVHRSGQDTGKHTGPLDTLLCRSSISLASWSSLARNVKERFYGKPDQASLLRVFLYSYFPTLVCLACQGIPGERIGYPFQYSWASLVDQMVKNPPAMQETWV